MFVMDQEELNQRTNSFSELVDAFIEELSKVDRAGREGVEMKLSYWIKTIFPLLKTVHDIVNDDLNKYWQMLSFLSTMNAFMESVQRYKTEELFYVLSKLPQNKADFILGKIDDTTSTQLAELQLLLSKKEKDGFIQALRQTKYESICSQCWVLRYYYHLKSCLKFEEKNRKELLNKAYEKGFVSCAEQNIIDVIYNKIVDCHNYFYCKYDSDKRYLDGVIANILLAIALTLRQESYDFFLVYMHKIGLKIYYCVAWLFLERKDKLSGKDYDAICTILHDSHPLDYSYVSKDYFKCDNPAELDEFKRRYCEILDINNHDTTYSFFCNEEFSGEYSFYKMPQLDISARYELGIRGSIWHDIMEGYLDVSYAIPEKELINAQRQLENAQSFNGKCILLPYNQDYDEPSLEEPQPEQLSAADSNQTPPRSGKRIHSKEIDDFDISPNYFNNPPKDSDDHCKITNEEFYKIDTEKRAKNLEDFIKLLARTGCIDPDKTTMKSCAYAFTGIGFSSYRGFHVQPVYWHTDKVDILLFICTKLFKKNKKNTNFAKALEVFHVTAKNCTNRAESIIGTEFDVDFTKIFGKLKQSDSTDPSQS